MISRLPVVLVLLGIIGMATCYDSEGRPTPIQNIINNKDDEANIEEPCKDSSDVTECVRDFFRDHARCEVVLDADYKPFILRSKNNLYLPKANMTVNLINSRIKNLFGAVETFYINKNTGNLVMSARMTDYSLESKNAQIIISQRSGEPKVIVDSAYNAYPSYVITAVIPAGKDIAHDDRRNRITNWVLKKSYVTNYIPKEGAVLNFGSKFTDSEDPVIAAAAQALKDHQPTIVKEVTTTGAYDIFILYMQKYICNFGIKLPY